MRIYKSVVFLWLNNNFLPIGKNGFIEVLRTCKHNWYYLRFCVRAISINAMRLLKVSQSRIRRFVLRVSFYHCLFPFMRLFAERISHIPNKIHRAIIFALQNALYWLRTLLSVRVLFDWLYMMPCVVLGLF